MGRSYPAVPLVHSNSETNERALHWSLFGKLSAQSAGFIRLKPGETGDRWEAAPEGEDDLAKWWFTPTGDGQKGDGGLMLRVSAKKEGVTEIPLRYVPLRGKPQDLRYRLHVDPPVPPPEPPELIVEGETFKGRVQDYRTFLIRLKTPLAPGHRWEVKEAVYHEWNTANGDKWVPFEVLARHGQEGLFMVSAHGDSARIVFVQKRDGWQLFPDTVTLLLDVSPTPKC